MEAQGLRVSGIRFNEFAWLRIWVQSFRFGIRVWVRDLGLPVQTLTLSRGHFTKFRQGSSFELFYLSPNGIKSCDARSGLC